MTRRVRLRIEKRPNGVFVTSPDVMGLFLWGPPEEVAGDLPVVIEHLARANHRLDARLLTAISAADLIPGELTLELETIANEP